MFLICIENIKQKNFSFLISNVGCTIYKCKLIKKVNKLNELLMKLT